MASHALAEDLHQNTLGTLAEECTDPVGHQQGDIRKRTAVKRQDIVRLRRLGDNDGSNLYRTL